MNEEYPLKGDLGEALGKLKVGMYRIYKGVRFERTKEGYMRNGILCRDEGEMDILINEGVNALRVSINRIK